MPAKNDQNTLDKEIDELLDSYDNFTDGTVANNHIGRIKAKRNIKSLIATQNKQAEVEARQQMVDYYAREFRKGYKNILPKEAVEGSISWLQKEADRLQAQKEGE